MFGIRKIKHHIKYAGELFISEKETPIQAIKEFMIYRRKTTNDPILFFNITIETIRCK